MTTRRNFLGGLAAAATGGASVSSLRGLSEQGGESEEAAGRSKIQPRGLSSITGEIPNSTTLSAGVSDFDGAYRPYVMLENGRSVEIRVEARADFMSQRGGVVISEKFAVTIKPDEAEIIAFKCDKSDTRQVHSLEFDLIDVTEL